MMPVNISLPNILTLRKAIAQRTVDPVCLANAKAFLEYEYILSVRWKGMKQLSAKQRL